jgi:hypothetical protein
MRALNGWAALGLMACAASTFAASVTVEGVFRSQITFCTNPGCFDPATGEPVFTETGVEVPFVRTVPVEFLANGPFHVTEDPLPDGKRFVSGGHGLGNANQVPVNAAFASTMMSWFGQALDPAAQVPNGFRHSWGSGLERGVQVQPDGSLALPQRTWSFSEHVSFLAVVNETNFNDNALSFQLRLTDLDTPVSLADASRRWTEGEFGSFLLGDRGAEVFASFDRGIDGIGDHWQLRGFARITAIDGITPIPEPATWALWLGGFGALAAAARRRLRSRQASR